MESDEDRLKKQQLSRTEEILDQIGWGRYHEFLFWICGLSWICDNGWMYLCTVLILGVQQSWGVSETAAGSVGTCFMAGQFAGSFLWGYLADKYGRLYVVRRTMLIAILCNIVMTFSVNLPMLDVFSFIAGCGIGGDLVTIGSVFIEFCPPCKSWRFTLLNAICAIGGVLIPLLAFAYSASGTPQGWRWVTLTFGVINLIAWALRFFMYETPKFLISTGKAGRAEQILQTVAEKNQKNLKDVDLTLGSEVSLEKISLVSIPLNDSLGNRSASNVQASPLNAETTNQSPLNSQNQDHRTFRDQLGKLFGPLHRRAMIPLLIIWFFNGFSLAGITMFLPQFMARSGFSSTDSNAEVYMAMAIQQAAGVVSQVIATYLATTRLGRKWTLVFGLGIAAICLFLFLGAMNFVVLMFASTLFYFFLLMSFAVMYTITPESLPTDVRNFGFGLGSSALSVAMIVAPLLSGALIEGMNLQTGGLIAILIYAASLVLSCVASLWLKETRGISIDEDF